MKNKYGLRDFGKQLVIAMAVGLAAGCAPVDAPSDLSPPRDGGTLPRDSGTSDAASSEERGSPQAEPMTDARAEVSADASSERQDEDAHRADAQSDDAADASADRRDEDAPMTDTRADASADRSDEDGTSKAISQDQTPASYVKGIIGVGYGGIRIVSRDQGRTWGSRSAFAADGADDENLLRAVVYGKGLWIATGWKLVTSTDGVHWMDHGLITKLPDPPPSCNIIEGLAFKDSTFYAACSATLFRSDDGLKWTPVGLIGNTGSHLFLNYQAGQFVAYGDTQTSFRSVDGATWSILPGIQQATFCGGQFRSQADCGEASWFDGVYLRPDWKGKILRSTDGVKFDQVYVDDIQNTVYQGRAFAEGYVSP